MVKNKTIFVTGGTGNQGGAVARSLVQQGFVVKALARDPNSHKAQSLKNVQIDVVKGDLNDASSYKEYLNGVHGIFSVQTFENGVEKEIKQGITLATIGKEFGVTHFVYSSVYGANLNSGVPHLASKWEIENSIKQLGLPFTIIRPTSLFENFLIPQVKKGILKGKLVQPINKDTVQQYLAAWDIGQAAANIFSNRELYLGKTIPLATEQLTPQEVADAFTKALNKTITYQKLPPLITRIFLGKGLYKMFNWMNEKSVFSMDDVTATRKEIPNWTSIEDWIKQHFISDHNVND